MPSGRVGRYAIGVVVVGVALGLRKALEPATGTGAPYVMFFGAVVAASVLAGPGPGILATILSAPIGAYVFVVRAGFAGWQAATQAALFLVDALLVVFLSSLMRRARQAAEASEARHRDIIELAPDAFFLANLDGRLTDVNQGACRMLGYERDELIGKLITDVIPAEDRARLKQVRETLAKPGAVHRQEWRQVRKDGSVIPVEVSANIIPGGRWQAFVRDISGRKRIDDERQVFVSLLENSSDFIGIADPTGKPIYVNPAGRRMVGLPPDLDVTRTEIADYYPAEQRPFALDVIVKSMREKGRWSGETYFRHWQTDQAIPVSDEHFMIFDPGGNRVLGMGTVTRNITEARAAAREREELLAREQVARERAERANADLRESEERFRLIFEEAPIGMALCALDGRFIRVNTALSEIVGYPGGELEQLRFQDITHTEDLDSDLALLGRLIRGEIPHYQLEKRYVRKDGSVVPILLSASILRSDTGRALSCIAQIENIGERKRNEEALRVSEARFSGIISVSADAIISIDERQNIVLFNQGAEAIFGYSRVEVMGRPLDVLIPEAYRAAHRQHVTEFAAGRTASRQMGERLSTIRGRRKSGEEFPAEAAISRLEVGGHTILTVALRDVTDRKRIEEDQRFLAEAGAVLASSLDYEQTLTTLGQLMVRDRADWCIVDVVEGANRLRRLRVVSARAEQEPIAAALERLQIDRRLPHLAGSVFRTRQPYLLATMTPEELPSFAQSEEHLRLLRAIDPRSVIGVPLKIHGQLTGIMMLISSSPARVFTPADLRLAEALADRAALAIENGHLYQTAVNATQFRDEVLSVVAHDLRNPVASIMMQANALKRTGGEPERRNQRKTDGILRSAQRMNRLIGDLLDVTLIEAGQLSVQQARLSPRQVLLEAVETQRPLAASGSIDLQVEVPEDVPDVWGDQDRLMQVFQNLIGNAIKFTAPDGRIVVGAAPRDGEVLFWVADTGCGIAAEGLPHVFDRFWQARKTDRRGAGLGLPITRGIVEAHGGRIWAESTLGRGSIFFFTIPLPSHTDARQGEGATRWATNHGGNAPH